MLGWPLNWNMSRDIMRNDLELYEVSWAQNKPQCETRFMPRHIDATVGA